MIVRGDYAIEVHDSELQFIQAGDRPPARPPDEKRQIDAASGQIEAFSFFDTFEADTAHGSVTVDLRIIEPEAGAVPWHQDKSYWPQASAPGKKRGAGSEHLGAEGGRRCGDGGVDGVASGQGGAEIPRRR